MALPNQAKVLPGIWVFTRKHDHSAKTRFCVCGHRQILGRDYLLIRIIVLFSLVVIIAFYWHLVQMKAGLFIKTDLAQAFLHVIAEKPLFA